MVHAKLRATLARSSLHPNFRHMRKQTCMDIRQADLCRGRALKPSEDILAAKAASKIE